MVLRPSNFVCLSLPPLFCQSIKHCIDTTVEPSLKLKHRVIIVQLLKKTCKDFNWPFLFYASYTSVGKAQRGACFTFSKYSWNRIYYVPCRILSAILLQNGAPLQDSTLTNVLQTLKRHHVPYISNFKRFMMPFSDNYSENGWNEIQFRSFQQISTSVKAL